MRFPIHPRIVSVATQPEVTPVDILGSANIREWWRADMGIVTSGSFVTDWTGNKGNVLTTPAIDAQRPLYEASAINGKPAVRGDGVARRMSNASLVLPAPGTSPTFQWAVGIQHTWVTSGRLTDGVAGNLMIIFQTGSSPGMAVNNGSTVTATASPALGAPFVATVQYRNNVADEFRIASTVKAGNAGNNTATGIRVFFNAAGTVFGDFSLCELGYASVIPDFIQSLLMSNYFITRYGNIL